MPNIVLHGDLSTGHSGFTPIPVTASSNVTINGKKIALVGDTYGMHSKSGSSWHWQIAATSRTTGPTIGGVLILLEDDVNSCGDVATASSSCNITL
jgi:uncharacterized Zn-binding protein involved in type VI secretion